MKIKEKMVMNFIREFEEGERSKDVHLIKIKNEYGTEWVKDIKFLSYDDFYYIEDKYFEFSLSEVEEFKIVTNKVGNTQVSLILSDSNEIVINFTNEKERRDSNVF